MGLYSNFVKNITFPLLTRRFGFNNLMGELRTFDESQYWSSDQIKALQIERLRSLFMHAYKSTPYYRQLFDEVSFRPEKFTHIDELASIPLLTKNIIRDKCSDLLSTAYSKSQLHSSETGGTTGVKMKFWRNNDCLAQKEAARYRFEKWTGWNIGERMGLVWTAQQDYVGHWDTKARIKNELYERQVVFPAAVMDEETIETYLQLLQKKKPTMIRAFTSPIYEVASLALKRKLNCRSIKGIVTTGEPVYHHQRQTIERAFDCKVFDSYRCREVGPLAQECEMHNGLHINAESLFVEVVVPEDRDRFNPGVGEIVVTDLLNFGMPLIRYKMGDMGIISDRQCSCGRGLPFIEKVAGRSTDMLHSPNGKKITAGSLVLYLVDEAPGHLGQVQIIQDKMDHLLIRMTPDPPPTEEIKEYQKKMVKKLFGNDMEVTFEIVKQIENNKSGKYQFTKYLV